MFQLAIITVIFNNYTILDDFFASLGNQTDKKFRLLVVDLSTKKEKIDLPVFARLIEGENKGYAYGVNLGLKKALKGGLGNFAVVNSDTILKNDFVEKAKRSLVKNRDSLISGKIYYAPGFEYHHDRYQKKDQGKIIWYAGGKIDWDNVYVLHRGVDELDKGQLGEFQETEFISGCLMIFNKKVLEKIGFWDEKYFLYYEDADYCLRARNKDIKLYYDPTIVIWHKNAQSTDGSGSPLHQKYQAKGRFRFGLKYAPLKTKLHLIKNSIRRLLRISFS